MEKLDRRRSASWLIVNAIVVGLVYFAINLGNEGAGNVLWVLAWLEIVTVIVLMMADRDGRQARECKARGRGVPRFVALGFDLALGGCFAWMGWLWTAGLYLATAAVRDSWYHPEAHKGADDEAA